MRQQTKCLYGKGALALELLREGEPGCVVAIKRIWGFLQPNSTLEFHSWDGVSAVEFLDIPGNGLYFELGPFTRMHGLGAYPTEGKGLKVKVATASAEAFCIFVETLMEKTG